MSLENIPHGGVIEELGMPPHGREHTVPFPVASLVKIPRGSFDGTAEVGGAFLLLEPLRVFEHFLL